MSRMRKVYKQYERWVLLGLVILLLATFSITGATSCQNDGPRSTTHLGGTYLVAPGERAELSDEEFDVLVARWATLQQALRTPSREFRREAFGSGGQSRHRATWRHQIPYAAGQAAGYRAGPRQVSTAAEELVGFALQFGGSRLPYSDVNYKKFLAENYRGSETRFREGVGEIVVKDQFLYPIIQSSRYQVPYPEAYEAWKQERERVDLQSIALPAAPFAEVVRKRETTRLSIGELEELMRRVVSTAASVRRVHAKVEAVKEQAGSYPKSLGDIPNFNPAKDPWDGELRYTLDGDATDIRSAGPDKAFDTADDITMETQRQLDTHANLLDLGGKLKSRHAAIKAWPKSIDELKEGAEGGQLPLLTADILDGWKQPFVYTPGADASAAPTLASIGPDGQAGTADDLTITLDPDHIVVAPAGGLTAALPAAPNDAWGKAMRVELARANPPVWQIVSAGPDGDPDAADDNVTTGNERELRAYFNTVRTDHVEEAKREFETLFVHLPLVSDAAMKRLWEAYPQHRPTDEEELFTSWRAYRGDVFYKAQEPGDAEHGHGAQHARDVAPEAKPTLVPSKELFPADLAKPDAPAKDDEPKDDGAKDDESKKDDDPDAEDRKTYREKGWREILIRQQFFERLLNDILKRVRESAAAVKKAEADLAAWEKKRDAAEDPTAFADPKPEVPAELTFESVLKDELGELVASGDELTPPAIQYWKTPKPMTRAEYEANPNFGTGLQYELNRLAADGDYNSVPAQLATRLTKVLVRRLAYTPQRQKEFEEVKDEIFDGWVERQQIQRARESLEELQKQIEEAEKALGDDASDDAKATASSDAIAAWAKKVGVEPIVERTGLFIGSVPPPAVEVTDAMDADTKAAVERRNFLWRQGYATVRAAEGENEAQGAVPGTFGRRVLTDPVQDEKGTGHAYLVRVAERQFPSKHEFSPRRYTQYLNEAVFGDRRRMMGGLSTLNGRYPQALARWFDDMTWLEDTFELSTNAPLVDFDQKPRR